MRIGQEAFDDGLDLAAVDKVGVHHQVVGIEGTQRYWPQTHRVRDLVCTVVCCFGTFAHKDGVTRAVRVIGGLVDVVNQKQCLTGLRITYFNPSG